MLIRWYHYHYEKIKLWLNRDSRLSIGSIVLSWQGVNCHEAAVVFAHSANSLHPSFQAFERCRHSPLCQNSIPGSWCRSQRSGELVHFAAADWSLTCKKLTNWRKCYTSLKFCQLFKATFLRRVKLHHKSFKWDRLLSCPVGFMPYVSRRC